MYITDEYATNASDRKEMYFVFTAITKERVWGQNYFAIKK